MAISMGKTTYYVVVELPAPGAIVHKTPSSKEANDVAQRYEAQTGNACTILVEAEAVLLTKGDK